MSRLRFAAEEMGLQETNLIAANGRIVDADIAAESTPHGEIQRPAQASASMLAQANTSGDVTDAPEVRKRTSKEGIVKFNNCSRPPHTDGTADKEVRGEIK